MKNKTALLLLVSPLLNAGTPDSPVDTTAAKPDPWITPLIDIRARYEYGDMDGFDPSHAFTIRERLGFKTKAWNGFSFLAEGEFTQSIIDDYHSGDAQAHPVDPSNTTISDPENYELNQLFAQYAAFDTTVKVGRQKIIYDNAAFIGNVGWRQNEQTYDAASISSTYFDDLTINYAYVNRVNRIFGTEATNFGRAAEGDINLLNLSYTGLKKVTLGAYAYLMDFDDAPPGWDNQTFGVSAKGKPTEDLVLYGEFAWQEQAGPLDNQSAIYGHTYAALTFLENQTVTLGFEYLDAGFQTPLATVHAFNGFSDVLAGPRIAGTLPGLADLYVSHQVPIFWGMKWTNVLHAYGDNSISTNIGWEYNSVISKKFNENFSAMVEISHFETESLFPTTTRASLGVTYTF